MEVTVDKTPTSPKLLKAIFKENLVFYLGFVAIAPLTTLSRYFHALISKFQAQFCSQSDKLESEAKLNNYFI